MKNKIIHKLNLIMKERWIALILTNAIVFSVFILILFFCVIKPVMHMAAISNEIHHAMSVNSYEIRQIKDELVDLRYTSYYSSAPLGGGEFMRPNLNLDFVKTAPQIFPLKDSLQNYITSYFGKRRNVFNLIGFTNHTGIDIAGPFRAEIIATGGGVVCDVWPVPDDYFRGHPLYGGCVVIDHGNGVKTLYGHLSAIYVTEGQQVPVGFVIGRMGNTGVSRGEHLHYEVQINNEPVNPLDFIKNVRVDGDDGQVFYIRQEEESDEEREE